jgi:excisionase family DNA binding protein
MMRTDDSPTLLIKPGEAARLLEVSERKLWELTNRGDIPSVRIGRSVRYSRRTLERWITERELQDRR